MDRWIRSSNFSFRNYNFNTSSLIFFTFRTVLTLTLQWETIVRRVKNNLFILLFPGDPDKGLFSQRLHCRLYLKCRRSPLSNNNVTQA